MSEDAPGAASAELTLHEDQLQVETERVSTQRVVLRRRIIAEVVEVTVRREVLDVEHLPLPGRPSLPHDATVAPLVIVLSEEVPDVQLRICPSSRCRLGRQCCPNAASSCAGRS